MRHGKWETVPVGGQDERWLPADGTAEQVRNLVREQDGTWRESPGLFELSLEGGARKILGMRWFQPSPNIRWLVFERTAADERSVDVIWLKIQTGTVGGVIRTRPVTPGLPLPSSFVDIGRWLYIFNFNDSPFRWDGYRLRSAGFTTPPRPPSVAGTTEGGGDDYWDMAAADYATAPVSAGASLTQLGVGERPGTGISDWRYGYFQTDINDLGMESPPSPMVFASGVNATGSAGGKRMVRVESHRRGANVKATRFWRTRNLANSTDPGLQAQAYLLGQWPVNSPFIFMDQTPDARLGLPFDATQRGLVPLGPRAAVLWDNRLWLGGMADSPNRARFSAAGLHEQFPEENYRQIGSSRTGGIVAFVPVPRGLVAFTPGGIYLVKREGAGDYVVYTISEADGTAAPQSIELVPDQGLFFLQASGPAVIIGTLDDDQLTKVVPLGGVSRRTWRRFTAGMLDRSVSVYDPELREVWWQIPEGGNAWPSLGLVYYADLQLFGVRAGYKISCFTRYQNRTWVGTWSATEFGLHLLTWASDQNSVGTITAQWLSNPLVADEHRTALGFELRVLANGHAAVIKSRTDQQQSVQVQRASTPLVHSMHDQPVWNGSLPAPLWDDGGVWGEYRPAWVSSDVYDAQGHEHQFGFSADHIRVVGARARFTAPAGTPAIPKRS